MNFHPALLPVNRGWYPHVHSLLDGSPAGVTLHQITEGADQGDIWVQKEVAIENKDTSKDLYLKLQKEIVDLFMDSWEDIATGRMNPTKQIESNAIYHSKDEIVDLDKIDLKRKLYFEDFLKILKARSFGDSGFAYL